MYAASEKHPAQREALIGSRQGLFDAVHLPRPGQKYRWSCVFSGPLENRGIHDGVKMDDIRSKGRRDLVKRDVAAVRTVQSVHNDDRAGESGVRIATAGRDETHMLG